MGALFRTYRLAERGGAGLSCDETGLTLCGIDLVSARQDEDGVTRCSVRSPSEFARILRTAYGPLTDAKILQLHGGLCRAAAWIEGADIARAGIEAVTLGLPDLEPAAMAKMAKLKKGDISAWENEPRIPAGQTGGGQWTTGGASTASPSASATAPSARPEQATRSQGSTPSVGTRTVASRLERPQVSDALGEDLLIPVSTGAVIAGAPGAGDFALPESVARMGRLALLPYAATLLDEWDDAAAREQIAKAMVRFSLDPSRPADVMAATAYVWSQYHLGFLTAARFSGPDLDAASQAVMRYVLLHPGAMIALSKGSPSEAAQSLSSFVGVANAGLADYIAETHARPPGVAPELQTTSRAARAAIAEQLKSDRMQAHHLVPAYNWGVRVDISALAQEGGWEVNGPNNLIALPADLAAQAEHQAKFGEWLPVHNGSHSLYNDATAQLILAEEAKFVSPPTPLEARAIMEEVSRINKVRLMSGYYGPIVRVAP